VVETETLVVLKAHGYNHPNHDVPEIILFQVFHRFNATIL